MCRKVLGIWSTTTLQQKEWLIILISLYLATYVSIRSSAVGFHVKFLFVDSLLLRNLNSIIQYTKLYDII